MIYRVGRTRFKLGMAARPEREALKRVRHEEMAPRSGSQPNLGADILAREVTGLRAAPVIHIVWPLVTIGKACPLSARKSMILSGGIGQNLLYLHRYCRY